MASLISAIASLNEAADESLEDNSLEDGDIALFTDREDFINSLDFSSVHEQATPLQSPPLQQSVKLPATGHQSPPPQQTVQPDHQSPPQQTVEPSAMGHQFPPPQHESPASGPAQSSTPPVANTVTTLTTTNSMVHSLTFNFISRS